MYGQPEPCVLIAGNGVAASALACVLRDRGFGVVLLTRRRPRTALGGVVEALPEATVRLFAEVGLAGEVVSAGAVAVRGFENSYGPGPARRLEGMWTHVDRAQLARECVLAARRRGAAELPVADVGTPTVLDESGVQVCVRGVQRGVQHGHDIRLRGVAAVDATGRVARWSRPVSRAGTGAAALFSGPGSALPRRGCVARIEDGWAYRLDHPQASTVGIVTRPGVPAMLQGHLAARLAVADPQSYVRIATRPAGVQWCDQPVTPVGLAIGDAALAFSPVAGQGLRFALASALAAAAVLTCWNAGTRALACDYYRSFVEGARTRHLAKLATIGVVDPPTDAALRPPGYEVPDRLGPLRFTARIERVGINVGGRIVADNCCVLPDGGLVRWVGGFDLLQLRAAIGEGRTWTQVCAALAAAGVPATTADTLMAWALRSGVIAA